MMSLWDALRMNMMISYQELVRTFPYIKPTCNTKYNFINKGYINEAIDCFRNGGHLWWLFLGFFLHPIQHHQSRK
ncbi:hypothetical protein DL890_13545 [Klebsiella pneumoniae]|nr:hypothetical protein DL890_13545 [Klebsiella pneumoniae]